jgi:MFS family permease
MVSFWFPPRSQAWATGLVNGSALLGTAAAYMVFGFLCERLGWPAAFAVLGVVTALWTSIWMGYATDHPGQHPATNDAERSWIEAERVATAKPAPVEATTTSQPSWRERLLSARGVFSPDSLLRNRSLMLLTISYAAVNYFEALFMYWIQYYFQEVQGKGTGGGRSYATLITLAMGGGMFLGGWLADRVETRLGRRGRPLVPVLGMIGSALLLVLAVSLKNETGAVISFMLAVAAVGACEGPFWVTAIELGGRRGGTSAAFCNTGGNVGSLLAPVVTPLLSQFVGWQISICLAALFCFLGAGLWWWIRPAKPTDGGPWD